MYVKPTLQQFGSFRDLTQQGSPNQQLDFGSIWDFLGPAPVPVGSR